ncbi:uncharacterized protein isoform X2 [Takifugu rubripes]|uniref:uncharacterized protein isoform X2 n=1 Tax=Takifugu rubripes TaxID=31033 RepID=UPI001145D053|nr:uncharacterized protein LOC105419849 isoform X2 [Takifugu rubripes]
MDLHIRILLFTAVTVAPSCALQMTFSQNGGLFSYTISDRPAGADCDYNYSNATDHVIANNEGKPSLVWNSSLDGLVAFKCIEHLFFKATCDKGEFYSANVTVACEDLRSNEDAAKGINPVTKGNMHNSSAAVTVAPSCALQMTFSQKGDLFFYNISDGPAGADCDYSYYNATNHPMANNYDKEPSLVWNSSLDGLVALKCIKHLFFKATCDKGEFYSANVTVACEDLRSKEDAAKRINPVTKGNMHNSSAAVTVAPSCALQMRFSQEGNLFYYTISDRPAGADCDYSYYNATNHPMANNYDKEPSLVRNSSLDGLVALKCIEHLFFKATCDKGEFYSANVTVACEDLRSNEDAAKGINPVTKGNMHNSSAAVTVAPSCALQMTFSQKGGLFSYTISDRPAGADCDYSYSNATDHVIANNYDKEPSLVLNSSLDGLVTLKCIEHLFFKATCDKGEFYSANVTVACEDLRSNEDAAKRINPVTKGNMHNSSSMPPSVTNGSSDQTVLAVVLVMWCKYKKKYEACCGKIFKFLRAGPRTDPY